MAELFDRDCRKRLTFYATPLLFASLYNSITMTPQQDGAPPSACSYDSSASSYHEPAEATDALIHGTSPNLPRSLFGSSGVETLPSYMRNYVNASADILDLQDVQEEEALPTTPGFMYRCSRRHQPISPLSMPLMR